MGKILVFCDVQYILVHIIKFVHISRMIIRDLRVDKIVCFYIVNFRVGE